MHSHKITILIFIAFLLHATSGTFSLYAKEDIIKGKPALPGKACQTKPLFDWTPQEKWVWNQICNGEIADFNERDKEYDKVFDPKNYKRKPKGRLLTPEFLETILIHEPFCGSLTHHGVRIVGAWFKDTIDLSDATLAHPLRLEKSRFDSELYLPFLKTDCGISLYGSYFNDKLHMNSVNISGYLYMKDVAVFKAVDLIGADIEGQFNMDGSEFTDKLIMDSLHVSGYLKMRNAEFSYVSLLNARIDSALEMDGSKFRDKLLMQRLEVGNNLYMRYGAEFEDVILNRSKIGGNLELTGSTFKSIDLTGTSISKEFRLSSKHLDKRTDAGPAKWQEESKLTLLNTKVGVLQDSISSWPKYLKVELNGFTYGRLGDFIADNNKDLAKRDITWLKKWLNKQKKYSPQPYEHLASVLLKSGHVSMANSILYDGRERKRKEMATWRQWTYLSILNYVIGYGYGHRIFRALYFVFGLVIIGVLVLRVSRQYCKKDSNKKDLKYWGLAYSIDMLLPIIHLRKHHYDKIEMQGWVRVYFYVHQILGYALALFVITGLTGIVK